MPKHDLTHEELDPSILTGVGNPLSPYSDDVLTEEEEKSIDDKGRLVIKGKLWSQAHTGRWLVVALHAKESATCLTPRLGQADVDVGNALAWTFDQPWTLSILSTEGKPRFLHPTVGACLELPDDLAEDPLKIQYLTEWLLDTVNEALQDRKLVVKSTAKQQFAGAVADAAQVAISKAL